MNATMTKESKLKTLERRLRLVGIVNIGLMLILAVCCIFVFIQTLGLGRSGPSDSSTGRGIHQMTDELTYMKILAGVCIALLLVWGPARIICLVKLKSLSKKTDA